MGSNSKLKFNIDGEEDRISNLPDNILSRILSFLPTKYAVLTSVLSSSWRYHWMTINNIDIDYDHLLNHENWKKNHFVGFVSFVYKVLEHCDSLNIHKFRLHCPECSNSSLLLACISFAVTRNVQELDLDIQLGRISPLPRDQLGTFESLDVLKLRTNFISRVPPLVDRVPNLKVLHVWCKHLASRVCEKLFSFCPKLEDFLIDARPDHKVATDYKINGPSLKRLTIRVPVKLGGKFSYSFQVTAPELESLYLRDDSMACRLEGSFPHLKRAILDVGTTELHEACKLQEEVVLQHLRLVASTRYLSLSLGTTTALTTFFTSKMHQFPNLACLEVTIHDFIVRLLLPCFLEASPNLQALILQMENKEETGFYSHPLNWNSLIHEEIPLCLIQLLKLIEIRSFRGQFVERNVIKFLLGNSKVLQKMAIHAVEPSIKEKFSKRILKLPRASKSCCVQFV